MTDQWLALGRRLIVNSFCCTESFKHDSECRMGNDKDSQKAWKYSHKPRAIFLRVVKQWLIQCWTSVLQMNTIQSHPQPSLPPTFPPVCLPFFTPLQGNLPASVFLGNTHQHSNRCHLATERRLWHIRQNKKLAQKEKLSAVRFLGAKITGIAELNLVRAPDDFLSIPCPWPFQGCEMRQCSQERAL